MLYGEFKIHKTALNDKFSNISLFLLWFISKFPENTQYFLFFHYTDVTTLTAKSVAASALEGVVSAAMLGSAVSLMPALSGVFWQSGKLSKTSVPSKNLMESKTEKKFVSCQLAYS